MQSAASPGFTTVAPGSQVRVSPSRANSARMSLEVSGLAPSNVHAPGLPQMPQLWRCGAPVTIERRCKKQASGREHPCIGQPLRTVQGEHSMTHRTTRFALIAAPVGACFAPAAQAQSERTHAQLHASAVASFQQGRFPEAYGRSRPGQCRPRARCRPGAVHVAKRHRDVRQGLGCHARAVDGLVCACRSACTRTSNAQLSAHRHASGGRIAIKSHPQPAALGLL